MNLPRISVLIPAYNSAQTLSAAISSAIAQTVPPHEIIIVDDGSKDDTALIAEGFGEKVQVIRQANGGPAAARNRAAKTAAGDWLALLDADDSWLPQKLERQIAILERENFDLKIGVVHSFSGDAKGDLDREPIDFDLLWQRNRVATTTVLVRREAFEAAGGFEEDRALIGVEDYHLWLRLASAGWKFALCPEVLVCYTPAANSLTSQTERFARAELTNAGHIARLLRLPDERLRRKQTGIYAQYGRDLLHSREMGAARRMLWVPLRRRPNGNNLLWWLATFAPLSWLNWKRRKNPAAILPFSPSRVNKL